MSVLDFNDRGQAYVSFAEFDDFMNERLEQDDYIKEEGDTTCYYNSGGCLLAKYYNSEGYGVTF